MAEFGIYAGAYVKAGMPQGHIQGATFCCFRKEWDYGFRSYVEARVRSAAIRDGCVSCCGGLTPFPATVMFVLAQPFVCAWCSSWMAVPCVLVCRVPGLANFGHRSTPTP